MLSRPWGEPGGLASATDRSDEDNKEPGAWGSGPGFARCRSESGWQTERTPEPEHGETNEPDKEDAPEAKEQVRGVGEDALGDFAEVFHRAPSSLAVAVVGA